MVFCNVRLFVLPLRFLLFMLPCSCINSYWIVASVYIHLPVSASVCFPNTIMLIMYQTYSLHFFWWSHQWPVRYSDYQKRFGSWTKFVYIMLIDFSFRVRIYIFFMLFSPIEQNKRNENEIKSSIQQTTANAAKQCQRQRVTKKTARIK